MRVTEAPVHQPVVTGRRYLVLEALSQLSPEAECADRLAAVDAVGELLEQLLPGERQARDFVARLRAVETATSGLDRSNAREKLREACQATGLPPRLRPLGHQLFTVPHTPPCAQAVGEPPAEAPEIVALKQAIADAEAKLEELQGRPVRSVHAMQRVLDSARVEFSTSSQRRYMAPERAGEPGYRVLEERCGCGAESTTVLAWVHDPPLATIRAGQRRCGWESPAETDGTPQMVRVQYPPSVWEQLDDHDDQEVR